MSPRAGRVPGATTAGIILLGAYALVSGILLLGRGMAVAPSRSSERGPRWKSRNSHSSEGMSSAAPTARAMSVAESTAGVAALAVMVASAVAGGGSR